MSGPTTATYLWPGHEEFPDGIMLKESSALAPEGHSQRMESYGRNSYHYARESAYAALVTGMYMRLVRDNDGDELREFADRMRALSLDVPGYEIEVAE